MNSRAACWLTSSLFMFLLIVSAFSGCAPTVGKAISGSQSKKPTYTEMVVQLEPRAGVKLKFLLIKPENPVASVILFPGGPGYLGLTNTFGKPRITRINEVYLVKNRHTKDASGISGRRAAKSIRKALTNSPSVTIARLSKGRPNSCLGSKWKKLSHFFIGRSDIVVESIVNYADMNL